MPTPTLSPSVADELQSLVARLDAALAESPDLVELADARFLETHAVFEGRSNQQQQIIEWFLARLRAGSREDAPADRPFRVLGVGCGTGFVDAPIAEHLSAHHAAVEYVGVDPNKVECEAMESLFVEKALPGVNLELEHVLFDDFSTTKRFDLIHFVHCLYYMPDPMAALERAKTLLAPGGELIFVQAPREALNELSVRFYEKHYGTPTLFADDLAISLDKQGDTFERQHIEAGIDVTPGVTGDTEVGLALRDFILQIDSARCSQPVLDIVERYLQLIASERGGRSVIDHPVDAFVMS